MLINLVEENSDITESAAFREYQTGTRPKIRPPWAWIISVGIITAVLSIVTNVFAALALENPYALNFLIGLYGIPAGFLIATRNKTLSFLVAFQHSSYSAGVFTIFFLVLNLVSLAINPGSIVGVFIGIGGSILSSLVIGLYCIFTFGLGALLGTFFMGVRDSKK